MLFLSCRFVYVGKGPGVNQACLKSVLSSAFQQRRKMLRQSLKPLLRAGQTLPEEFATRRPEQVMTRIVRLLVCVRETNYNVKTRRFGACDDVGVLALLPVERACQPREKKKTQT